MSDSSLGSGGSGEPDQRIRVAVRMRPLLPAEREDGDSQADWWSLDPAGGVIAQVVGNDGKAIEKKDLQAHVWPFGTDPCCFFPPAPLVLALSLSHLHPPTEHVFGPETTNRELYEKLASPVVTLSLRGYHGTCFAYGPTNSGKTYTMEGSHEDPGLVPHAVDAIFAWVADDKAREYLLRVSYLEMYNEELTDLLLGSDSCVQGVFFFFFLASFSVKA
jgi:hypothetical protein